MKKLRAPLFEPLQTVAELEAHMGKFVLASLKLSATGHGEDSYRYFELFLESIKGFPLISTTLDGFYQRYPTVPQQNIRAQPRSQVGPSLPKPLPLALTDARKSRVSKRASGATGPTRERQLI